MRHNLAKEKLAAGKPVSVVAPGYSSAGLVELLGRMGFDAIFIDCEHGPVGWEDVEHMVRAAELVDVTPIVRVQSNDHSTITRALDRGAGGVQVPLAAFSRELSEVVSTAMRAVVALSGHSGEYICTGSGFVIDRAGAVIYNGAIDNASGVAGSSETMRRAEILPS